jgi:hypothetical protein
MEMVIATEISVYPNPFSDFLTIEVTCPLDVDCIILLANLQTTRIVRMLGATLRKGFNKVPLVDLQPLVPGSYLLDIKTADGDTIHQITVVRQ